MVAGAQNRRYGEMQRRLTAGSHHRAHAMIQCRHALFQHRVSRIGQPRVNVSCSLNIKQACSDIGIRKNESGALINRRRPCSGGGIRHLACVKR